MKTSMNFDSIFTEVYSKGSIRYYVRIGSGIGLVPNKHQAITATNADPIHRRIYASLGWDEF